MEYLSNNPWIDMTQHASDWSKFGIPSESVAGILTKTRLAVTGLHIHVGTQMDNPEVFRSARDFLHRIRDEVNVGGRQEIDAIDFGGGLGINFLNGDSYPSIDGLADALGAGRADGGLSGECQRGHQQAE